MRKSALVLPLLAILPLSAQSWEAGLFVGQQAFKTGSIEGMNIDMDNKVAYGVRIGHSVVDMGPVLLQVTAGYQPETKTTMTINNLRKGVAPGGIGVDYKASHYSLGAMFNFKTFVAVGAGVEYRFEKLEAADWATSTNYARPWFRANAGIAIPSPVLKPFVGLEVAFPLTTKSFSDVRNEEDALKAVAPKSQIGIYAGIRF